MKTTRSWFSFLLLLVLLVLAGCIPKRVVWSPDGKQAAVLGDKGLYLCDAGGNISGLLVPDVTVAQWFADSRRLAIAHGQTCRTWDELQPLLDAETRERIVKSAPVALEGFKAGQTIDQISALLTNLSDSEKFAAGIYLKGLAGTKEAVGTNWPAIEALEMKVVEVQVGTVADGKINLGPVLASGLEPIVEIRIAPNGTAVAYTIKTSEPEDDYSLMTVPVNGSAASQLVAEHAAWYPDWSADSRSLVYIRAVGASSKDDLRLASLERREVLDAAGLVKIQPQPDSLAGLLFYPFNKVRCLDDGRIIFSSADVRLPATVADMPKRQQLFALDPDRQPTLTPLIPANAQGGLPEDLSFFEISPDQKKVSVLGDKGSVVVLTLATGNVETVQTNTGSDSVSVPTWRSDTELCFINTVETNGVAQPAQVALWGNSKARIISSGWSEEVRSKFLDK